MEHTMANIRTAYGKREQVDSSSSAGGNGFVFTFVSKTEVPTFKKTEKKQILQILRYDCSGRKMKLKHVKRYYAEIFQVGDVSKYAKLVFNSLDKQRTGEIFIGEFVEFVDLMATGSVEDRITASFHFYDTNTDGLISRKDIIKVSAVQSIFFSGWVRQTFKNKI
jgi:Ca2+-binding EF-hand superfamily protein